VLPPNTKLKPHVKRFFFFSLFRIVTHTRSSYEVKADRSSPRAEPQCSAGENLQLRAPASVLGHLITRVHSLNGKTQPRKASALNLGRVKPVAEGFRRMLRCWVFVFFFCSIVPMSPTAPHWHPLAQSAKAGARCSLDGQESLLRRRSGSNGRGRAVELS